MSDVSHEVNEHELVLVFGRFLSEGEWREVVDACRKIPHVVHLRAEAVYRPREEAIGDGKN